MEPSTRQQAGALAIVAGGGEIPIQLAQGVADTGRKIFIIAIEGLADEKLKIWPHIVWKLGALGQFFSSVREHGCTELVLIGRLPRPRFRDLSLDIGAVRHIPGLLRILTGGDGSMLNKLADFIDAQGISLRGAHEIIAGNLCLEEQRLGSVRPGAALRSDIEFGVRMARAMGSLDVGQGVVVDKGRILAVEAAEGTDLMLLRCKDLRSEKGAKRSGVLVKVPRPGQDLRIDMPTIGKETVRLVAAAGLAGLAVERGRTLAVNKRAIGEAADKAGIFVATVKPPQD